MGKIKNTQDFIARAIQIHGDKFDYTLTVFRKYDLPITIICKTCGPFELKQAESHYRKGKNCGCKVCNKEQSLIRLGSDKHCKACGVRIKYTASNTLCRDCMRLLSDDWASALTSAESRLLGRHKQRNLNEWDMWAKRKQAGIASRKYYTPRMILRAKVVSWDAWAAKATKKQRKEETPWQMKCRRWSASLSRRETRLAEES